MCSKSLKMDLSAKKRWVQTEFLNQKIQESLYWKKYVKKDQQKKLLVDKCWHNEIFKHERFNPKNFDKEKLNQEMFLEKLGKKIATKI